MTVILVVFFLFSLFQTNFCYIGPVFSKQNLQEVANDTIYYIVVDVFINSEVAENEFASIQVDTTIDTIETADFTGYPTAHAAVTPSSVNFSYYAFDVVGTH